MNFQKKLSGETLLEATIAVSVLAIVLTYAGTLFTGGIRTLAFSRDRAIAVSMAEEGIEGMKNITGSNMLRLSSDKDNCWNAGWTVTAGKYSAVPTPDQCAANKIGNPASASPQYFRLLFNSSNDAGKSLFRLEPQNMELKLKNTGCDAGVSLPCLDPSGDSAASYRLYLANGSYTHESGASGTPVNFYRSGIIQYMDADAMKVISKVTWIQSGKSQSVEYATYLTSQD